MKKLALLALALAAAVGTAQAGTPVWVTSDVPTDESSERPHAAPVGDLQVRRSGLHARTLRSGHVPT